MPEVSLLINKESQLFKTSSPLDLACAFSARKFKNMSFFYGDTKDALGNRKNFLANLGIDCRDLVCAKQIHAIQIRYVQKEDKGKGALSYETAMPDTDALITDKRNLPLGIFTADCLPIFLYEPTIPAIGLVHAGWRSTKENIIVNTVKLMEKKFNIRIDNLCVGFGPAIRKCCYEVGKDFSDFSFPELIERDNRCYLDLPAINKKQLLSLRVKEKNIFDSMICTSCRNQEFFSYRKEGKSCGRMMSVIMLK